MASRTPYLKAGTIAYKLQDYETTNAVYIPVGIFITAWARDLTIRSAQKCYSRFVYADTDSLHLLGWELPEGLEIDKYKLGAWKQENKFIRARFLRTKCYFEDTGKMKKIENSSGEIVSVPDITIKCSGLPKEEREKLNWDNFHIGYKTYNKLKKTHVVGGIILKESPFEIK